MKGRVFVRDDVGRRLLQARKARGLKQSAVAAEVGCRSGDVSSWEHGRYLPGATSLALLALTLRVSTDWILFGTGKGPSGDRAAHADIPELHIKESSYA